MSAGAEEADFIETHTGQTLHHFADSYATLEETILEAVQNALDDDVRARNIWINVNEKGRTVTITDDGCGVGPAMFASRLKTVCTRQRKGAKATGRFGIGLMSALGKCKLFRFTSCPAPATTGYLEWTFDCKRILESPTLPAVPRRERPELCFGNPHKWRSMMELVGVVEDQAVTRISMDDLRKKILINHGSKMRELEAKVSIRIVRVNGKVEEQNDIQARLFRGEALPEFCLKDANAGDSVIRLFLSPLSTKGDSGQGVLAGVIGDSFRLPFASLARQLEGRGVDEKALAALKSGVFEGEVLFERLELRADRKHYAITDALDGVAVVISRWFKRVGSAAYERAREARRDTRNVERAIHSLEVLERLLQQFPESVQALQERVQFGSVGKGHANVPKARVKGTVIATALRGHDRGREEGGEGGDAQTRSPRPEERKGYTPLTAAGPGGKERKIVRGNSIGLCVAHEMLESNDLWEFDQMTGTMTFNVQHPVWARAEDDGGDRAIYLLQEFCMLGLVTMLGEPEQSQEALLKFSHRLEPMALHWLSRTKDVRAKPAK